MKLGKKLLSLALVTYFIAMPSAYAADYTANDRGIVTFSETFDISDYNKSVEYNGNTFTFGDWDRYITYRVLDANGKIHGFGPASFDALGNVAFSFRIKGDTGEYKLILSNVKFGQKTYTIDYVSNIYIDFNDVKNANDADLMKEFVVESGNLFGFDVAAYNLLSQTEQDSIIALFMASADISSTAGMNDLADSMNVADVLFTTADAADLVDYIKQTAASDSFPLDKNITKVFTDNLTDAERLAIAEQIKGSALDTAQKDKYDFEVLKAYVKQVKYFTDMDKIILSQGNIWGFAADDLTNYASSNVSGVQQDMMTAIDTVTSLAEYRTAFNTAITNNPRISTPPSLGGGGGGGGGGGTVIKPSLNTKDEYGVIGDNLMDNTAEITHKPDPKGEKVDFKDLDGYEWAEGAINALVSNYIINGVSASSFEPSRNIKREEFVKMITSGLRLTGAEAEVNFADAASDAWYYEVLGAAQRAGLVNGDDNGNFGVGQNITRQDAAVILARTAAYKEFTLPADKETSFTDEADVADYAKSGVSKLSKAGIINGMGDGRFAPDAPLTRAEAAKMLYELFNIMSLLK